MAEQFSSEWRALAPACRALGLSVRTFHRLRAAGRLLPAVHYYRAGMGSRAPLQVNIPACRLALRVGTRK